MSIAPATTDSRSLRHDPAGHTPMSGAYLEVENLRVTFDGFVAIDSLDIGFYAGDLHFLIGPNGAGKTTLVDAITGLVPSTGTITLSGQPLNGEPVQKIARAGVGRTFQTASVFEDLTVAQNLDIAAGAHRSVWQLLKRTTTMEPAVAQTLHTIGLEAHAHTKAGVLSHGQKQWLEIGMLIVQDAKVLLLDEPVAGMSAEERNATGALLREIAKDHAVVVVEHDMNFVRDFATTVTVLAQGAVLAAGSVEEVHNNPEVQQVYLGTAAAPSLEENEVNPS